MDYDGGVFLWNIIFKTCKALAAELLQLHQIFTLSLYFITFPTTFSVWLLQLKWTWLSLLLSWALTPQDSVRSHQHEEEKGFSSFRPRRGMRWHQVDWGDALLWRGSAICSERSWLPPLGRSCNLFPSFYLTGACLWPRGRWPPVT